MMACHWLGQVEVKSHLILTNFSQSHCQVMSKDKRPGVAAVLAALYPEDDKQVEIVDCSGQKSIFKLYLIDAG